MTPFLQARQAYAAGRGSVRSARSVELEIFGSVTASLRAATIANSFPQLAAAMHDNRRLWTRLAADVADSGNALPATLRAQIFYLAEFTELHSRHVLHDDADPAILIEINTAMMRGLGDSTQARAAS
ncbi:MAG: flagellar biosynthesis regulator FlaF [Rubellimicrobium sp.]|nr:flagellar biosynthesis regulator FlaF [Rubellimicrobium sp.]